MAVEDPERAPSWARDLVLTALRRAYPDPVPKQDLQHTVGIGPEDLRRTIGELEEERLIEPEDDGWTLFEETPDRPADPLGRTPEPEIPSPVAPEAAAAAETAAEPDGHASTLAAASGPGEGPYRARVLIEVVSFPEPEGGTSPDDQALVDADAFREAAIQGVLNRWADLQVGGRVVVVEAFDGIRRVWPREEGR